MSSTSGRDEPRDAQPRHPRAQLNEAIHQPVRLSILALLAHATRIDFAFLRDQLDLKDSNLSQHLSALEALGYVTVEKGYVGKRPRTWVSLSPAGRAAFDEYVRVLRRIVEPPPETPAQ
ncbi:MAG: winged helix-turn-helix domain-containing protein [Ktedonobacterales bacterium]